MLRPLRSHLMLVLAVAATACGSAEPSAPQKTEARSSSADGAMCEEHGVLEAICTKCHPKLIAVFQAKGDYCAEHGLPMSVCPIHHPERGGRPAVSVASDKAPPEGTKVRLKTSDSARLAGIKIVTAERRPGGERLEAVATITYDATRWAQVNARAAGVVREIKVDVGATVRAGTPIAILESATVGADRSRLKAAASHAVIAETTYQREVELNKRGVSAHKDVLAAQQELDTARAELAAANAAVGVIGGGAGGSGYVVVAPIAGVVTKRNVTIGNMVAADERVLFEIVDTRTMRAEIEIPEAELRRVRVGQEVVVTVDALPGIEVTGRIDYLAPEVTRETRTTKARATLANPDGALRANMFGRARIALAESAESVVVPRPSVQRVAEVDFVFVKVADGAYELHRVKTGARDGERVEITQGIKAGDQVVTEGSFLLKTETLKGSIGAGCCE
jgi:membrane fusion protein, heavy metal efflux system